MTQDHLAAKLAAMQAQLLRLTETYDALYPGVTAAAVDDRPELPTWVALLRQENARLTLELAQWQTFKQSRTYRLHRHYARLYETPRLGRVLTLARRLVSRMRSRAG